MRSSSLLQLVALAIVSLPLAPLSGHRSLLAAQEKASDTLLTVDHYLDFETVSDPQISPDGTRIIYSRRFVDKQKDAWQSALWIMNADGSENRFLARGGSPTWSPDGTRIAYLAEGDAGGPGGAQILVRWMNAEGATSQVTRVANAPGDIAWSPDGRSIGFAMFSPKPNDWAIDMPAAPAGAEWTPAPRYVNTIHYRADRRGYLEPGFVHLYRGAGRRRHPAAAHARGLERGLSLRWPAGCGRLELERRRPHHRLRRTDGP